MKYYVLTGFRGGSDSRTFVKAFQFDGTNFDDLVSVWNSPLTDGHKEVCLNPDVPHGKLIGKTVPLCPGRWVAYQPSGVRSTMREDIWAHYRPVEISHQAWVNAVNAFERTEKEQTKRLSPPYIADIRAVQKTVSRWDVQVMRSGSTDWEDIPVVHGPGYYLDLERQSVFMTKNDERDQAEIEKILNKKSLREKVKDWFRYYFGA